MENAKHVKGEGIRMDLVRRIQKQIKNNSYEIKSGEIAYRLAQELFSADTLNKNPTGK